MRVVDVLGLFGFMLLGLVVLAFWRPVADVLAAMTGGNRGSAVAGGIRASAGVFVVLFSTWMAGGSALVALKVLEPRPGPYPGGALVSVGAVIALAALAAVLIFRVIRPLAAASQRRGDGDRDQAGC